MGGWWQASHLPGVLSCSGPVAQPVISFLFKPTENLTGVAGVQAAEGASRCRTHAANIDKTPSLRRRQTQGVKIWNVLPLSGIRSNLLPLRTPAASGFVGALVVGYQVVLELGMSELIERADRAQQANLVAVIQERHHISW